MRHKIQFLSLCSNRAQCYLMTNQPRNAIRDCNRALAMNPFNLKVRELFLLSAIEHHMPCMKKISN